MKPRRSAFSRVCVHDHDAIVEGGIHRTLLEIQVEIGVGALEEIGERAIRPRAAVEAAA